ncbi:MAG TPA: RNA polymerase sigma-70 factor [Mucilaginibacter sp.]
MVEAQHTDKELLEMIAQKNERALTLLHNRYYEALCTTAYKKVPDEPAVEEIVQDVFVVLWEKSAQLDMNGDVKSYLFATLRNKVLHEIRSRIAKTNLAALFQPVEEISAIDASDLLQAKELEQRLHAAIEELSPQSREAFKLSRFEQLPYKIIANRLNISVGTVEKHISKALSILRKEFGELDNSFLIAVAICLMTIDKG